ncbi:MAG: GNAT family N-acetyltransferase [Labedaea sp.]
MEIHVVPYDHPDAARMIDEVQQEYVVRYGGPDESAVQPAEFAPPQGLFLVGYLDGAPVTCGGWRAHPDGIAEVKRMYVAPSARGKGLARAMLAELERTARGAGHRKVILETGSKQPEAVALYRSSGYTDVPGFGYYADAEYSIHLGKSLGG